MRHLLITCVMVALLSAGCRSVGPQVRPAPGSVPVPAPARLAPAAPAPQPPAAAVRTDVPELASGPEDGGRPHENPATPPPGAYMRGDPALRLVALTFDDGPDGVFTPKILDVLRQNHVSATFFVIGTRANAHPDMLRRMAAEGHEIGNHSFHHPLMTKLTARQVTDELTATSKLVSNITGRPIHVFRPPYGEANALVSQIATSLGYRMVLWDIDSLDWKRNMTSLGVVHNVVPNIRNGAIILHHSAGGNGEDLTDTVQALPTIIKTLRAQGYRMVTASELLRTGHAVPGRW